MAAESLLPQYVDGLIEGNRQECKRILQLAGDRKNNAEAIYTDILWPAMEQIDRMYREDRINIATEHMATRISRWLASQAQNQLEHADPLNKRILILCADGEPEELGAAMAADLFEARGWDTFFAGGGVPDDEVLSTIGRLRPDILLIFGTTPQGVPGVRRLIDLIREVGVHPTMNVLISGGVFRRAEGLWQEVNADHYVDSIREALEVAPTIQPRKAEIRIPGAPKKRRRRRRPPLLAEAEV